MVSAFPDSELQCSGVIRIWICHPERVIKALYLIVLIGDTIAIVGCAGTVQANCVNFSNFAATSPFGTRNWGASPLLPKVNLVVRRRKSVAQLVGRVSTLR